MILGANSGVQFLGRAWVLLVETLPTVRRAKLSNEKLDRRSMHAAACHTVLTSSAGRTTIRNGAATMAQTAKPGQLKARTLEAFEAYVHEAETEMEQTLHGSGPFLWSDSNAERAQQVRGGKIVAQSWSGRGPVKVPDGLIHDWIAAAFIADTSAEDTLALIQDYDNHKNIYKPEVIDSKLISRHDNNFQIYLRLLKKKIITVILDTEHRVQYRLLDQARWLCRSYTTRIAEVENAGSHEERVSPPDTGHGFLWRLYSYWRLQ
jgi:hypothetical protein